jgi:hypothetical protein
VSISNDVDAYVECDGNVTGEIEMHRHRNKLVQKHQVVGCDQQDEHKNVFLWLINVRTFHIKKKGSFTKENISLLAATSLT